MYGFLVESVRSRKKGDAEGYVSVPVTDAHHPQVKLVSGHQVEELQTN